MKIAVIADIHGNIHALNAVLQDIDRLQVDQVVVNGDLINRGPNNTAVMERIFAHDFIITLGNHEDLIRKWADRDEDIPTEWFDDPLWQATAVTTQQLIDAGWIDALRDLPMTHEIKIDHAPVVLISHGSPRHYREGYCAHHLTKKRVTEITERYPADIYIGSHTHQPVDLLFKPHRFLNTGAVGTPFNRDPRAQYLLLTLQDRAWEVTFRAVEYDYRAAVAAFEKDDFIHKGDLGAHIFREELKYNRSLFDPFWRWVKLEGRASDWASWRLYAETLS